MALAGVQQKGGSSEMSMSGIILLSIAVSYFSILWLVYQRLLMNLLQETWKFCFSLLYLDLFK